jgi:hypothetical protein
MVGTIALLCCSSSVGFLFLYIAGISFLDPLSYTEFFDELQDTMGIKPHIINVKNQLWLHRIVALLALILSMGACVFSVWVGFLQPYLQ